MSRSATKSNVPKPASNIPMRLSELPQLNSK